MRTTVLRRVGLLALGMFVAWVVWSYGPRSTDPKWESRGHSTNGIGLFCFTNDTVLVTNGIGEISPALRSPWVSWNKGWMCWYDDGVTNMLFDVFRFPETNACLSLYNDLRPGPDSEGAIFREGMREGYRYVITKSVRPRPDVGGTGMLYVNSRRTYARFSRGGVLVCAEIKVRGARRRADMDRVFCIIKKMVEDTEEE